MNPSPETIDQATLEAVEADIADLLGRLANPEELTAADLEEFRQSLPTEPALAELVQLALPFPWSELFEYVEASDRQSAYWRTSLERSAVRSAADREHKRQFAEAAKAARGETGTVDWEGKEIPASAATVTEAVSGRTSDQAGSNKAGRRALRRLRIFFGE